MGYSSGDFLPHKEDYEVMVEIRKLMCRNGITNIRVDGMGNPWFQFPGAEFGLSPKSKEKERICQE
jgi:hypothetical protein